MRLDVYLVQHGYTESRERAKRLIVSGAVCLDGTPVDKPALDVTGEPQVTVTPEEFVGRGGEKLKAALSLFNIDVTGLCALDVGASTGGFTQCLLERGAASVIALDAGIGQLHPTLRDDARVTNIEKYNARYLSRKDVGVVDLVVMDVSFISATYIIPNFPDVLKENGEAVVLIKPQFEAGRAALNKKGIVKNARDRLLAVQRVLNAAAEVGLSCTGLARSPILGGDGNEEYLARFQKGMIADLPYISAERVVLEGGVCK